MNDKLAKRSLMKIRNWNMLNKFSKRMASKNRRQQGKVTDNKADLFPVKCWGESADIGGGSSN